MPKITRKLTGDVTYFDIGSQIMHSWFTGRVIGINYPRLLMWVIVQVIKHPAPGRTIGSIKAVPFNHGQEIIK